MKKIFALLISFSFNLSATTASLQHFWVQFADKQESPFSVERPQEFLSPKSIARRQRQQIQITSEDLPVNPHYIQIIKNLNGVVNYSSKWFNAVTVICNNETAEKIRALPFVKKVEFVGKYSKETLMLEGSASKKTKIKKPFDNIYGFATEQIEMFNGHKLHELGFWGEGMMIAVLDAGFYNVDKSPFFEDLRQKGNLKYGKDYVYSEEMPYQSSLHGSQVLSVMAANIPGLMVGTAPEATYVCIKTEDSRGEFRLDECNWIAGVEYADSLGVDIINSSLGYSFFDDDSMNYSAKDLDGKTALSSRAAEIASKKGMIVISSAGNEGNNDWQYVTCPSDAKNILAVGAINNTGRRAAFSSIGLTSHNSIKPDVMALGEDVAIASSQKPVVLSGNGTSYAAPIIAGLTGALWQAFPNKTNQEILHAIKFTAKGSNNPNTLSGNGTPDFLRAYRYLQYIDSQ